MNFLGQKVLIKPPGTLDELWQASAKIRKLAQDFSGTLYESFQRSLLNHARKGKKPQNIRVFVMLLLVGAYEVKADYSSSFLRVAK